VVAYLEQVPNGRYEDFPDKVEEVTSASDPARQNLGARRQNHCLAPVIVMVLARQPMAASACKDDRGLSAAATRSRSELLSV
jgi:hypothetical protein